MYENDRNGLLNEVQYGNGGKVGYTYDEFDRLTGVKYDGETSPRYTYEYGTNGQASEVKDANLGRTVRTENDLSDRPCQVEHRDTTTNELLYQTRLKYDKLGDLVQFAEKVGSKAYTSEYTYDRDNRVTDIAFDGDTHKVGYVYDELDRVMTRTVECGADAGKLTSTYEYMAGGYGANSTTPLVTSISQEQMAASGGYSKIGLNRSLKTMGLSGRQRPDVIGIARVAGKTNRIVEVVSQSQTTAQLSRKVSSMINSNAATKGRVVSWVGHVDRVIKSIRMFIK